MRAMEKHPQFIVGTPGRLMDFMQRGVIRTQDIRCVALDEVDRMLDIGFRDDIRRILSKIHGKHQTVFASATIDNEIKRLIERHTNEPVWINVSRDQITVTEVDQSYVTCGREDKFSALLCVLRQEKPDLAIIFTNTKGAARRVARRLEERGFKAAEIHGDLLQRQRESVMKRFREQDVHLLIATDLASRGIDVNDITHIINYDLPVDPEVYVHRIGRTARMGKAGKAITLVTREEGKELTAIEMLTNIEIPSAMIRGYQPAPAPAPAPQQEKEAAAAVTAVAEPARPKSLGANFKPMRRRRRL
jgi:ATP-dependent RNA helicase DeaD